MMDFHYICGLPILYTKIDPKTFNKEEIITIIKRNYSKQKVRQKWSKSFMGTDIHHSNGDEDNKNFETPNYSLLVKSYSKPIEEYKKFVGIKKEIGLYLNVANYTCSSHKSFMEPHFHIGCEFSMIHYLNFKKTEHSPTMFINPLESFLWWSKKIQSSIKYDKPSQSWLLGEFSYPTEEDDLIIFPSMLRHFVNNKTSQEPRITIASNITLIDKGENN